MLRKLIMLAITSAVAKKLYDRRAPRSALPDVRQAAAQGLTSHPSRAPAAGRSLSAPAGPSRARSPLS